MYGQYIRPRKTEDHPIPKHSISEHEVIKTWDDDIAPPDYASHRDYRSPLLQPKIYIRKNGKRIRIYL